MPAEKFYIIDTISIIPQYVTITKKNLLNNNNQAEFKLELWLGSVLLSQTYDLKRQEDMAQNQSTIKMADIQFKYFASNIFTKASTTKFKLKLYKGDAGLDNSQQIQQFTLVLSKFSYNYCTQPTKTCKQHSVGSKNCSILYYRIQCEYLKSQLSQKFKQLSQAENQAEENQKSLVKLRISQMIDSDKDKQSSSIYKKNRPNQWLSKNLLNVLPLNSLPEDAGSSSVFNSQMFSSVFIETEQLKPIYNTEGNEYNNMKFKVQKSYYDVDKQNLYNQQESIIQNRKQFEDSQQRFLNIAYYLYIILAGIIIYYSLYPNRKV